MPFDRTRTLRGALAGGVAAGAWLAQQPLDQRVFGRRHDDAERLGRLASAGPATGALLLVQGGALFGAVYAGAAPHLPVPAILRGPLAALAGHAVTWPVVGGDRDRRAFGLATWRRALFGVVLGELERRLNPPWAEPEPVDKEAVASNGHGSAARLVATGPVGR